LSSAVLALPGAGDQCTLLGDTWRASPQGSAQRQPSATQIDPRDGSNVFGSWLHSTGVAVGIVGGVVAVAGGGS